MPIKATSKCLSAQQMTLCILHFYGVHGNYLKGSVENAGLDPNNLPEADKSSMNFGSGGNTDAKAWKIFGVLAKALVQ